MATQKYPDCECGLHLWMSDEIESLGLNLSPPEEDCCIRCGKTFDEAVSELFSFLFIKQLGLMPN